MPNHSEITERICQITRENSQKVVSEWAELSQAGIGKWVNNNAMPNAGLIQNLCLNGDISANWLLLGKGPYRLSECSLEPNFPKISGKISNQDKIGEAMKLIEEWVRSSPCPERLATRVIFAVEDRYRDFEEWQEKKRAGDCGENGRVVNGTDD